jgi:hypothetical protein
MKNKCLCGHTKNFNIDGTGECRANENDLIDYHCACKMYVEETPLQPSKEEKICVRCGVSQNEVEKLGMSCNVWGETYLKHKYSEPSKEENVLKSVEFPLNEDGTIGWNKRILQPTKKEPESKEDNWEERFEEVIFDLMFPHYGLSIVEIEIKKNIKDFIRSEKKKSYVEGRENKAPMGVSQWQAHGEKYGYWDFLEKKYKSELIEEIKAVVEMNMTDGRLSPYEGFKNILDYLKANSLYNK